MEKLLEKRVSAYFQSNKIRTIPNVNGDVWASWPMSKLSLYKDKLVVEIAFNGKFELQYSDIDYIEKNTFTGIQIHHHDQKIKPYFFLGGFGNGSILYKNIVQVIKDNELPIKIA